MVRVLGRLHWNGATFPPGGDRKHDERMVVEKVLEGPARVQHEERLLTAENVAAWEAVIDSYHRAREHDRTPLTNYGDYIADPKRWRTLLPRRHPPRGVRRRRSDHRLVPGHGRA